MQLFRWLLNFSNQIYIKCRILKLKYQVHCVSHKHAMIICHEIHQSVPVKGIICIRKYRIILTLQLSDPRRPQSRMDPVSRCHASPVLQPLSRMSREVTQPRRSRSEGPVHSRGVTVAPAQPAPYSSYQSGASPVTMSPSLTC